MSNLFKRFQRLLQTPPLLVGDVVAVDGDVLIVQEPGGGQHNVRGEATVGARVFFRDGVAEGPAPDLTYVEIEV